MIVEQLRIILNMEYDHRAQRIQPGRVLSKKVASLSAEIEAVEHLEPWKGRLHFSVHVTERS